MFNEGKFVRNGRKLEITDTECNRNKKTGLKQCHKTQRFDAEFYDFELSPVRNI